jgi:hypothetical protein
MTSIRPPTLYSSLYQGVAQTIPDACDSRLANLLFMMMGVFLAQRVDMIEAIIQSGKSQSLCQF